ncbi:unnamed protein product [Trichogramma brassicae]|uniref:Uncharacterized protein n=1 Tax=Trichogramma brassicae TaxID=86971 RepID=A0A6H5IP84_9HYME|nr:unnamed protein product [Trichogramma brassicae]
MMNRMRVNHTCLAESLERKNIISDPRCRCGCEEESLNHVSVELRSPGAAKRGHDGEAKEDAAVSPVQRGELAGAA